MRRFVAHAALVPATTILALLRNPACALATGPDLTLDDLPERVRSNGQTVALMTRARERRMTLRELEKEYILEALRMTSGNKSRAAEILGFDRRTLHRKLDEYRAEDPSFEL